MRIYKYVKGHVEEMTEKYFNYFLKSGEIRHQADLSDNRGRGTDKPSHMKGTFAISAVLQMPGIDRLPVAYTDRTRNHPDVWETTPPITAKFRTPVVRRGMVWPNVLYIVIDSFDFDKPDYGAEDIHSFVPVFPRFRIERMALGSEILRCKIVPHDLPRAETVQDNWGIPDQFDEFPVKVKEFKKNVA